MKAHFVEFVSPGTFFHETTVEPIDCWDVTLAVKMAGEIVERHAARPFAFRFLTRERGVDDLDSKVVTTSHRYFLGGRVMTLADVERETPNERILISNMRNNDIKRVVVNTNSWLSTTQMSDDDVVLDVTLPEVVK